MHVYIAGMMRGKTCTSKLQLVLLPLADLSRRLCKILKSITSVVIRNQIKSQLLSTVGENHSQQEITHTSFIVEISCIIFIAYEKNVTNLLNTWARIMDIFGINSGSALSFQPLVDILTMLIEIISSLCIIVTFSTKNLCCMQLPPSGLYTGYHVTASQQNSTHIRSSVIKRNCQRYCLIFKS